MDIVTDILTIPEKSIYGLFDDHNKRVWIGFSSNTPLALVRTLENLKSSNIDLGCLKFRVIEQVSSNRDLRVRYQIWSQEYSNQGWTLLRSFKAVQYKLHTDVISHLDGAGVPIYYFRLSLCSSRYKKLPIGVFNSSSEMESFINTYYSPITKIVYAQNELTKKYVISI